MPLVPSQPKHMGWYRRSDAVRKVYAAYKPPLMPFYSDEFDVYSLQIRSDADYAIGMATMYENGEQFVNIEHDMQVSDDRIYELFECPLPFCTWAYRIHRSWIVDLSQGKLDEETLSYPNSFYAQHNVLDGRVIPIQNQEVTSALCSGIGFCKITPDGREFPIVHWTAVEQPVQELCQNVAKAWHIHWPEVEHWHR